VLAASVGGMAAAAAAPRLLLGAGATMFLLRIGRLSC
jgi:hypothetical protein